MMNGDTVLFDIIAPDAQGIKVLLSMKESAFDPELFDVFISSMNRDNDDPDSKETCYEYNND